jgi:stage III sporulation protein AF
VLQIEGWVRALAAILLLAGVAELLLPAGSMKGYARGILGLLVLLAVLQPAVGLLHGEIRLELPALAAVPAAAPLAEQSAQAESAAARAYERLVAGQAARIAEQVPGVEAASATLQFAGGAAGTPQVEQAAVAVTPTAAALAQGDLQTQVQSAVAAGLGLAAGAVTVRVW